MRRNSPALGAGNVEMDAVDSVLIVQNFYEPSLECEVEGYQNNSKTLLLFYALNLLKFIPRLF